MKTFQINFRDPNIDRFIEIMMSSIKLNYYVKFNIINLPLAYKQIPELLDINLFDRQFENSIVVNEYPTEVKVSRLFDEYESYEVIKERVNKLTPPKQELTLNGGAKVIFKNAIEKLNINNVDHIQQIVDIASIIAVMENSYIEIRAEHIAEAIQYYKTY